MPGRAADSIVRTSRPDTLPFRGRRQHGPLVRSFSLISLLLISEGARSAVALTSTFLQGSVVAGRECARRRGELWRTALAGSLRRIPRAHRRHTLVPSTGICQVLAPFQSPARAGGGEDGVSPPPCLAAR